MSVLSTHSDTSAAGVEGAGGSGGPGCGARGLRQGAHTEPHPIGGRREACGAWPGFEPTRRAKLAGGPPPTGTHSGQATQAAS